MQPPNEFGLVVCLPDVNLEAEFTAGLRTQGDKLVEGGCAVNIGLPRTQPTQVRPIEHEHPPRLTHTAIIATRGHERSIRGLRPALSQAARPALRCHRTAAVRAA